MILRSYPPGVCARTALPPLAYSGFRRPPRVAVFAPTIIERIVSLCCACTRGPLCL